MVRRAKELVSQKGIMSTPDPKLGHPLSVKMIWFIASMRMTRLVI